MFLKGFRARIRLNAVDYIYCCHAVWTELFLLLSNILNECKENFIIDLIYKFCCWTCCAVISSYIIKELKKLVSCLYGVIMHSGGRWENTREACKTLDYASCFTSFSRILPTFPHRALLHHKGTRLVF